MAGLTTHILDLANGVPASGVKVELYRYDNQSSRRYEKTAVTNQDGRLDQPFLSASEIETGEYEMVFFIGEYFRQKNAVLEEPLFLDKVPVRFGISSPNTHYHVPLLVSPWGYQVYRGS